MINFAIGLDIRARNNAEREGHVLYDVAESVGGIKSSADNCSARRASAGNTGRRKRAADSVGAGGCIPPAMDGASGQ